MEGHNKEHSFVAGPADSGRRLDQYLAGNLSGELSRSYIQKLIKDGHIRVNGETTKSNHKLKEAEKIAVNIPPPSRPDTRPENIPLTIIYEDEHLMVVDKPAGMVAHPAAGNFSGTLVNALLYHSSHLSGIGGELKPGIVHRLDKGTSGLMVVAKTDKAHHSLAEQFKSHKIKKKYLALVKGEVGLDRGIIDEPIGRNLRQRKKMEVVQVGGKSAVTSYEVVKRFKAFTLVEISPTTGRTHQIRVHMSYLGHSIIGDAEYGQRSTVINRHALHASLLGFYHPATGKYLEFSSTLPEDIKRLIAENTVIK